MPTLSETFLKTLARELDPDRERIAMDDLKIQTKDKRLIAFAPNGVQCVYLDTLAPNWRRGEWTLRGQREILLKARQFGFSTLILALFYLDTVNRPGTKTVVIAHDSESTEGLFEIVQRFHDNLPNEKRPRTRFANRRQIVYPGLNSSFNVMTAGTKTSGRSKTIHNLHMSEVAFWEHPEVLTGLLQAVPKDGNVFQETTANGEGNQYYHDYQEAKEGRSTFTARFFAWWQHEEYRTSPSPDFTRTEDEEALVTLYGLDDAQLCWRRHKIKEPGMGSLFVQEYPGNDVEAFRVSGSKFFTDWSEERHVVTPSDIPRHFEFVGGLDWGYGVPFCFLLAAIDERGDVTVVDEIYHARLINADQADLIARMLAKWGLSKDKVEIYADPAMWAKKVQSDGVGVADIEAFWSAGLRCWKANNNHAHGWSNLRAYLHAPGALRVFRGNCPNLIRTMPMQIHDKTKVEDIDQAIEHHAPDTLRYLLNSRIRPSTSDLVEKTRKSPKAFESEFTETPAGREWRE